MTSGGHSMTEAWNLQLQGRVRELETDLAEAERHLDILTGGRLLGDSERVLARGFLKRMADKRAKQAEQAKEIDSFLAAMEGERT